MNHRLGRLARARGPEAALVATALLTFLGLLGSVDLWGKREQRAAAEALDTVEHHHWLIAEIQGRQRLEKPPLPRWTAAALMVVTGRSDEWVVRFPSAVAAVGVVLLVYDLGRRMGGRSVGLAAGLAMCTTFYAITEHRQAGNDGPLALWTTLALYAAWRRLHGPAVEDGAAAAVPAEAPGGRRWNVVAGLAIGLGFLTKGPVILVIVALTVVPYLALARRLRPGLRLLLDWRGALPAVGLALCWPVPVLLIEPEAINVWWLEMGQKVGAAGVAHHDSRTPLVAEWFWMAMPWTPLALLGLALPFTARGRDAKPGVWFPWMWAFANLAMFSTWSVAKPNYYVPCLPGVALLAGREWVRVARSARHDSVAARAVLQLIWVGLFVIAVASPVVVAQSAPELLGRSVALGAAVAVGVVGSAWAWRRGADGAALLPVAGSVAVAVLIAYGAIARPILGPQSHRPLAAALDRLVPADEPAVMFFHELDEGLWFYLRDRSLEPVPDSAPRFNDGYEMVVQRRAGTLIYDPNRRLIDELSVLLSWIVQPDRQSHYLLIRDKVYDRFAPALDGLATEVYRESDLRRNELVLLRIDPFAGLAAQAEEPPPEDETARR